MQDKVRKAALKMDENKHISALEASQAVVSAAKKWAEEFDRCEDANRTDEYRLARHQLLMAVATLKALTPVNPNDR